jgi:hypothetical protein
VKKVQYPLLYICLSTLAIAPNSALSLNLLIKKYYKINNIINIISSIVELGGASEQSQII